MLRYHTQVQTSFICRFVNHIGQGKREERKARKRDAWGRRVETVGIVEALWVFPVIAHFAVVPGRIGADSFVPYAQIQGSLLEKGFEFALCREKSGS